MGIISSSRGSSHPRDGTHVSCVPCTAGSSLPRLHLELMGHKAFQQLDQDRTAAIRARQPGSRSRTPVPAAPQRDEKRSGGLPRQLSPYTPTPLHPFSAPSQNDRFKTEAELCHCSVQVPAMAPIFCRVNLHPRCGPQATNLALPSSLILFPGLLPCLFSRHTGLHADLQTLQADPASDASGPLHLLFPLV